MKWRDLEISEEELVEIIKNKCGYFVNDFIKNGIPIYRNGSQPNTVRFFKTKKQRKGYGTVLNGYMIQKEFAMLSQEQNIPSRFNNAVFGIIHDWKNYRGMVTPNKNYLFPVGHYTFSYAKDTRVKDFNKYNDSALYTAVNQMVSYVDRLFVSIHHSETLEVIQTYTLKPLRELIKDQEELNDLFQRNLPAEEAERLIFKLDKVVAQYDEFKNIGSHYNTTTIPTKAYSGNEILFNCNSYIMVNIELYPNLLEKLKS